MAAGRIAPGNIALRVLAGRVLARLVLARRVWVLGLARHAVLRVALGRSGRRRLLPLRGAATLRGGTRVPVEPAAGYTRLVIRLAGFLRIAHGSAPFGSLRQRHHLAGNLWTVPDASSCIKSHVRFHGQERARNNCR